MMILLNFTEKMIILKKMVFKNTNFSVKESPEFISLNLNYLLKYYVF